MFLPRDVVRLKHNSVDINPEYSDSLDIDIFTMDLMFEKSAAAIQDDMKGGVRRNSFNYHQLGKGAFEAGLDEVS